MRIVTRSQQRAPRSCHAISSRSAAVPPPPRASPASATSRCIAAATSGASSRIVLAAGGACVRRSELLKANMIVAFTAHPRDVHMEGNYWLALLSGPAFPVPESQVRATDQFEAGWLVVKAQWFELLTTSPRCYRLQAEERCVAATPPACKCGPRT
mmetsp:Transcript_21037/g.62457  ORF Transcript_21037/g.62457 Transcript_21037/m.62457 type:complete len:156 (+) Transcript_21037:137-604(+)